MIDVVRKPLTACTKTNQETSLAISSQVEKRMKKWKKIGRDRIKQMIHRTIHQSIKIKKKVVRSIGMLSV